MLGGGGAGKTEPESWENVRFRERRSQLQPGLVRPHWDVQSWTRTVLGIPWSRGTLLGTLLDLGWGPGGV